MQGRWHMLALIARVIHRIGEPNMSDLDERLAELERTNATLREENKRLKEGEAGISRRQLLAGGAALGAAASAGMLARANPVAAAAARPKRPLRPLDQNIAGVSISMTGPNKAVFLPDGTPVRATAYELTQPFNPVTAAPIGRRQHKPFTIIREIDAASPVVLQRVISQTEVDIVVSFLGPGTPGASPPVLLTAAATGAHVVSYQILTGNQPALTDFNTDELEEFAFTYSQIEWTYTNGGKSST